MTAALRELLGYDFQIGQRIISMWDGGNEAEGRFHALERARDMARAIY